MRPLIATLTLAVLLAIGGLSIVVASAPSKPAVSVTPTAQYVSTGWELTIALPSPGYKRNDGTQLHFTEFKETQLVWGPCGADGQPTQISGIAHVESWRTSGRITVPDRTRSCIVAVVIGLDGQPMGRSEPIEYAVGMVDRRPNKSTDVNAR